MKKTAPCERFFDQAKVKEAPARTPPGSSAAGFTKASLIRCNSFSDNSPAQRFLLVDLTSDVLFLTRLFMASPI
ncbi:hypothetical protein ACXR0M_18760 [Pseudomonas sp. Eth.TT006]